MPMITGGYRESGRDLISHTKTGLDQVKDFNGPCAIYQVFCERKEATKEQIEMCAKHNRAMDMYRNREFEKAIELFEEVLTYKVPARCRTTVRIEQSH